MVPDPNLERQEEETLDQGEMMQPEVEEINDEVEQTSLDEFIAEKESEFHSAAVIEADYEELYTEEELEAMEPGSDPDLQPEEVAAPSHGIRIGGKLYVS